MLTETDPFGEKRQMLQMFLESPLHPEIRDSFFYTTRSQRMRPRYVGVGFTLLKRRASLTSHARWQPHISAVKDVD